MMNRSKRVMLRVLIKRSYGQQALCAFAGAMSFWVAVGVVQTWHFETAPSDRVFGLAMLLGATILHYWSFGTFCNAANLRDRMKRALSEMGGPLS